MNWGLRAAGVAGVVASGCWLLGDVLLLGAPRTRGVHPLLRAHPELDAWIGSMLAPSVDQLMWGALAGVLTTPLYLLAVWHLYRGLRPAGKRVALPPVLLLGASWCLAPFIHGSFFYLAEVYRAAGSLDGPAAERLLLMAEDFGLAIEIAYWVYGALVGIATLWMAALIVRGETHYPRWGVLAAPGFGLLAGMLVCALLAGTPLQGAGLSVGHLMAFGLSTTLLWRAPSVTYRFAPALVSVKCG